MKTGSPPAQAGGDLLQILVLRQLLTRERAERVRRQARSAGTTIAETIQKLGLATSDCPPAVQ